MIRTLGTLAILAVLLSGCAGVYAGGGISANSPSGNTGQRAAPLWEMVSET